MHDAMCKRCNEYDVRCKMQLAARLVGVGEPRRLGRGEFVFARLA